MYFQGEAVIDLTKDDLSTHDDDNDDLPVLMSQESSLNEKGFKISGVPSYPSDKIQCNERIGGGTFGDVYTCVVDGKEKMALKKMVNSDVYDEQMIQLWKKEIQLLHRLDHKNVIKFHGVCEELFAILLELAVFDFKLFGHEKRLSSLKDFLGHVDSHFNFDRFEKLPIYIASDIANGLKYLHELGITHRDLKTDNILITNQHYASLSPAEVKEQWKRRPIISKITDFGESRSEMIQTRSFMLSRATGTNLNRGTLVYAAPETQTMSVPTLHDLQKMDMWSFGMVLYCLTNPDVRYPYFLDIQEKAKQDGRNIRQNHVKDLLLKQALPKSSAKYAKYRSKGNVWATINRVSLLCLTASEKRITADNAAHILLKTGNLKISNSGQSCNVGRTFRHFQALYFYCLI